MANSARIDELKEKFDENPRRYFAPLANEYRKGGDPDQAIAICREFLPQQPGHMSGYIVYGQALFDAQQVEEARTVFDTALALDPENLIALRQLGDIARSLNENDTAKSWYQRVLDADPRNVEIAAILTELDASGNAAAPAEAAEAPEAPEAPVAAPAEAPEDARAAPADLELMTATAPPPEELLDIDDSQFEPDAPVEPRVSSPLLSLQAMGMEIERSDDETVIPATPDVARAPAAPVDPFATPTMAELYLKQGHVAEALDVYRRLLDAQPEDEGLRARVAELEARGETDEAAALVQDVPDLDACDFAVDMPNPEPGASVVASGPSIREFLAALAARVPSTAVAVPEPVPAPAPAPAPEPAPPVEVFAASTADEPPSSGSPVSSGGSINNFFGGTSVSFEDQHAASILASAFGAIGAIETEAQGSASEGVADHAIAGAPARRATEELSLDSVFREPSSASAPDGAGFSFDRFFSGGKPEVGSAAGDGLPHPSPPGSPDDDIEQFNSWLDGLKKP